VERPAAGGLTGARRCRCASAVETGQSAREDVIVDTALMWCGELSDPAGDFTRKSIPGFIREYGTPKKERPGDKAGLVRLLRSTHTQDTGRIVHDGGMAAAQFARGGATPPACRRTARLR